MKNLKINMGCYKVLPPNTYWVLPGRLLAGEYPGDEDPEEASARLQKWLDLGVNYFIDLTEPGELEPYQHLIPESQNVTATRFPIPDIGLPPKGQMIQILNEIDGAIQKGVIVYLHCRAGIGRTGTVVGCYFARHGYTGQKALDELELVWDRCEKSAYAYSPETLEQCEYIINWEG
ncbi:MAG: hypothetical protein QF432_02260 [Dehalococcoidales bacterium]|nr:hypothetical protein [Dehalococcoidales bacterium]